MKAQPPIVTACFYCWLLIIGLAVPVTPQVKSQFLPIPISKGETVHVIFEYLRPIVGATPHGDTAGPWGDAKVTQDDDFTSIDIRLVSLPPNPGRYFLYLVYDDNTAEEIQGFGTELRRLYQTSSNLESFRMAVSTKPGLSTITPPGDGVIMISIAP